MFTKNSRIFSRRKFGSLLIVGISVLFFAGTCRANDGGSGDGVDIVKDVPSLAGPDETSTKSAEQPDLESEGLLLQKEKIVVKDDENDDPEKGTSPARRPNKDDPFPDEVTTAATLRPSEGNASTEVVPQTGKMSNFMDIIIAMCACAAIILALIIYWFVSRCMKRREAANKRTPTSGAKFLEPRHGKNPAYVPADFDTLLAIDQDTPSQSNSPQRTGLLAAPRNV